MPDHLHALPTGYKLNEYRLERVLGSGGFGTTYYAWDENLDKPVAIKEYLPSDFAVRADGTSVRPKSDGESGDYQWGLNRFLDEAQTLARFDHPHLNQVYRFFEAHGTAYLVLDYIDGETLAQMLSREEKLSEAPLLRLLNELLSGLEEVHQAGFVHRDVKPGNIMLRADGSAVLLDFGAARQAIGAKSKSVTSILTPGYAPIEQYDQKADDVGAWSDIYALGMVAYRCVSGVGESELIDAVTRSRFERKGELEKDIEPAAVVGKGRYVDALLAGIDWAIKIDETERPQSVAAMRSAIGGGQSGGAGRPEGGQAVSRPPSKPAAQAAQGAAQVAKATGSPTAVSPGNDGKPTRKHGTMVMAVLAMVVAAVAGAAWWQQSQKQAAAFTAELSYWSEVDCGDKAEVQKYLIKYPAGEYRQAADDCIAAVDAEVKRKADAERTLTITTKPSDAEVRLLGIPDVYRAGMRLPKGTYTVQVKRRGYVTQKLSIKLNEGVKKHVALKRDCQTVAVTKNKCDNVTRYRTETREEDSDRITASVTVHGHRGYPSVACKVGRENVESKLERRCDGQLSRVSTKCSWETDCTYGTYYDYYGVLRLTDGNCDAHGRGTCTTIETYEEEIPYTENICKNVTVQEQQCKPL